MNKINILFETNDLQAHPTAQLECRMTFKKAK